MVEALMSGTPVICSDRGACPEIISGDVGFVCKDMDDYASAVNNIASIKPKTCREKAMKDYHFMKMTTDYIDEYQKEIERNGN
jgi:glycosyltransferase involved in cell wall biosynthesis